MSSRDLRVIALNVNSIVSSKKRMKLEYFLQSWSPDVVLLSETKLNLKNRDRFPSYLMYRNDRLTNSGGGTAIQIKNTVKHEVLNTPSLRNAEASIIKVPLKGSSVSIVSFYNPKKLLRDDLDKLVRMGQNIFLAGDFNAKHVTWRVTWNNQNNNSNGNALNKFLLEKGNIEIHYPDEYTCWRSGNNPSTIDIAISKNVNVSKPKVHLYD